MSAGISLYIYSNMDLSLYIHSLCHVLNVKIWEDIIIKSKSHWQDVWFTLAIPVGLSWHAYIEMQIIYIYISKLYLVSYSWVVQSDKLREYASVYICLKVFKLYDIILIGASFILNHILSNSKLYIYIFFCLLVLSNRCVSVPGLKPVNGSCVLSVSFSRSVWCLILFNGPVLPYPIYCCPLPFVFLNVEKLAEAMGIESESVSFSIVICQFISLYLWPYISLYNHISLTVWSLYLLYIS